MAAPTAYTDAQGQNDISRNVRQYRDLDLFFGRKPVSGDVNTLTDVANIKRAVRNLILTNVYEKPFHPEIGSGVRDMLFEPMSALTAHVLTRKIEDVIENFEPRAKLVQVSTMPEFDKNAYSATISFYVQNSPDRVVVESFLERLR